jgi:hypothetical protein
MISGSRFEWSDVQEPVGSVPELREREHRLLAHLLVVLGVEAGHDPLPAPSTWVCASQKRA